MHIQRGETEPIRQDLSWSQRWEGTDGGLIACWERGRETVAEQPELAARARGDELVVLPWKGGVERAIKGEKVGSFFYLAMYQGLRGEPLDIDTSVDVTRHCSRTQVPVTFTGDLSRISKA